MAWREQVVLTEINRGNCLKKEDGIVLRGVGSDNPSIVIRQKITLGPKAIKGREVSLPLTRDEAMDLIKELQARLNELMS